MTSFTAETGGDIALLAALVVATEIVTEFGDTIISMLSLIVFGVSVPLFKSDVSVS